MTTYVGDVLRSLIPYFSENDLGTVGSVTDNGDGTYDVVDAALLEAQDDDHWNTAKVLWLNGDCEWAVHTVSDFTGATSTLVITGSTVPSAGDEFLVFKSVFSVGKFLQAINSVLMGTRMMLEDETVSIVDEQVEYTLPSGVSDVRAVELVDSDGEYMGVHEQWSEYDGTLRFDANLPDTSWADTLRIHYAGTHPVVDEIGDAVQTIHQERLMWEAAEELMVKRAQDGHINEKSDMFYALVVKKATKARREHPLRLMNKQRAMSW